MIDLCIKVEAIAGADVRKACADLTALADKLGVMCSCNFNGVDALALPGAEPGEVYRDWWWAFRQTP